jgi:hypothetical protein
MDVMTISNNWHQEYKELLDFIAVHSEIKIKPDSVSVPQNVRPNFYQLVNTTATTLVKEKLPALLDEAKILSSNYLKTEEEVTKILSMNDIIQPKPLYWFLRDPIDGFKRELMDLVFDLLKGKIDIEKFEEIASQNLAASFRPLHLLGYKKWVSLAIIKLLEADNLFQIILRSPDHSGLAMITEEGRGTEDVIPPPQESDCLSFDHGHNQLLIVPDFIVHSSKVNRYISLRTEIGESAVTATNASQKREWCFLDSITEWGAGFIPLYTADNPEEISLVADVKRLCKPDLIIDCKDQEKWFEQESLDQIQSQHECLQPRLGTYIVSMKTVPEHQQIKLPEGIHVLNVGFDDSKLEPIVKIIKP